MRMEAMKIWRCIGLPSYAYVISDSNCKGQRTIFKFTSQSICMRLIASSEWLSTLDSSDETASVI